MSHLPAYYRHLTCNLLEPADAAEVLVNKFASDAQRRAFFGRLGGGGGGGKGGKGKGGGGGGKPVGTMTSKPKPTATMDSKPKPKAEMTSKPAAGKTHSVALPKDKSRATIQQAGAALAEMGYKLGRAETDLKAKKTSYEVTQPNGKTTKMTSDEIKDLVYKTAKQ